MMEDSIKSINVVYRVLDFLPDGDPLKNRAKNKALDIMEGIAVLFPEGNWVSLGDYFSPEKKEIVRRLLNDADILDNYLSMGMRQGWLGGVNFMIASKECGKIRNGLVGEIARRDFHSVFENKKIEANSSHPSLSQISKQVDLGQGVSKIPDFSERQQKILKIMQKREKTQVADIVTEFPNLTKRTIRRDVDDLLKRGKILKEGEWSKTFYRIFES